MIELPDTCMTVPLFTSVTVTGCTVVVVVIVAVPLIPGLSSCTDNCWPFMLNRKSSGTVSSLVPVGSLIASGILLQNGCPPFVLTRQDAVAYFNPSSEIKFTDKRTVRGKLRLPKYQRAFREFLRRNVNETYVRRP